MDLLSLRNPIGTTRLMPIGLLGNLVLLVPGNLQRCLAWLGVRTGIDQVLRYHRFVHQTRRGSRQQIAGRQPRTSSVARQGGVGVERATPQVDRHYICNSSTVVFPFAHLLRRDMLMLQRRQQPRARRVDTLQHCSCSAAVLLSVLHESNTLLEKMGFPGRFGRHYSGS